MAHGKEKPHWPQTCQRENKHAKQSAMFVHMDLKAANVLIFGGAAPPAVVVRCHEHFEKWCAESWRALNLPSFAVDFDLQLVFSAWRPLLIQNENGSDRMSGPQSHFCSARP